MRYIFDNKQHNDSNVQFDYKLFDKGRPVGWIHVFRHNTGEVESGGCMDGLEDKPFNQRIDDLFTDMCTKCETDSQSR